VCCRCVSILGISKILFEKAGTSGSRLQGRKRKTMGVLDGKVAVVTGASKGIGAGIAKGLAEAGARVVVNYASSKEGADRVVAEITSKGGRAIAVKGDIAKAVDVKRLFQETAKSFGRLDLLVNNAGVYSFGPLESATEEEFHRQFNTNVLGLILTTQEAVKLFAEKGGSVINIGTAASQTGAPNMVLYLATKSAVDSVTRVLSKELGPRKIRVNSINPGGTETEGAHALGLIGSDFQKQLIAKTPLGRFGQPEDIARIAVFLASDASGWLTGEILHASGGAR
jgi:3-oxoacyl-[acyl-carrier protein] reductase